MFKIFGNEGFCQNVILVQTMTPLLLNKNLFKVIVWSDKEGFIVGCQNFHNPYFDNL